MASNQNERSSVYLLLVRIALPIRTNPFNFLIDLSCQLKIFFYTRPEVWQINLRFILLLRLYLPVWVVQCSGIYCHYLLCDIVESHGNSVSCFLKP